MLDYQLDFLDTADVFELGTTNFMGMGIANGMLEMFLSIGIGHIHHHVENLASRLIHSLLELNLKVITPIQTQKRAGIVSIRVPDPNDIISKLQENQIYAAVRGDVLRFSLHGTNSMDDVDGILDVLNREIKK